MNRSKINFEKENIHLLSFDKKQRHFYKLWNPVRLLKGVFFLLIALEAKISIVSFFGYCSYLYVDTEFSLTLPGFVHRFGSKNKVQLLAKLH